MDKIRSAFGYKRQLGGGERTIFGLSYGWVVQAHSNSSIVKLSVLYKVWNFSVLVSHPCTFMLVLFLYNRGTWQLCWTNCQPTVCLWVQFDVFSMSVSNPVPFKHNCLWSSKVMVVFCPHALQNPLFFFQSRKSILIHLNNQYLSQLGLSPSPYL